MKIITDNGIDIAPERLAGLDVEIVTLTITLDGKSYRGGVDIQSDEFYKLVRASSDYPVTSQPSPADFDEVYTRHIESDPEMISIHMSHHLSGTFNAARLGAEMAGKKGAKVSVVDSRAVSGSLAWTVEAAARAAKAGWSRERILALCEEVGKATRIILSPETLKYLVHGGRVSHIQGFAAGLLNIKPILHLTYEEGKLTNIGKVRTLKKAIAEHIDIIGKEHAEGAALRVQIEHADNPELAAYAQELMSQRFTCEFLPTTSITPVIGAHTGPGLVGIVYAPQSAFANVP